MAARRVIVAPGFWGVPATFGRMALRPRTLLLAACWVRGRLPDPGRRGLRVRRTPARSTRARCTGSSTSSGRARSTRINRIATLCNPAAGRDHGRPARRRRAASAAARASPLAVIALLGATSISSQLLKALLAYPRYDGVVDGAHVDPGRLPERSRHRRHVARARGRARGAAARPAASPPCSGWRSSLTHRLLRSSPSAGTSRATWSAASCSPPAGRW